MPAPNQGTFCQITKFERNPRYSPIHEDPTAVVVGVIGQEPVPLVLLLAVAISGAPNGSNISDEKNKE
jgi:hypothetical protein